MKKNNKTIEERLKNADIPGLSPSEREMLWSRIAISIETAPIPSPYALPAKYKKTMIPLLIAAIIFMGAGGTVAASDAARPGDTLFGVDRAVENIRLAFANASTSAKLKVRFSEERLSEVKELVAEARAKSNASATSTDATTTPDRKRDRVILGVNTALAFLNEVSADLEASGDTEALEGINAVIDRLENVVNEDDVKFRLKNNGDFQLKLKGSAQGSTGSTTASTTPTTTTRVKVDTSGNKDRIEIREEGERIRIEIKEGDIRVKTKLIDLDDDEDDDQDNSNRGKGKGRNDEDSDDD